MSYRLSVAGPAQRALNRLSDRAALAIAEFGTGPPLDNPRRLGKKLGREPYAGLLSARVGP